MGSQSLPSPPAENNKCALSRKSTISGNKSVKPMNRVAKRAGFNNAAAQHPYDHLTQNAGMDGRHKRVWKACERCRMKKTKCDGEFPCKRCKDDGLVCTAGPRKKTKYKQLPEGYAEVLEDTQFALIATVHKLYAMVRNSQQWDLGEPDLNDHGQPIIHNIAQKLGCIRPNSDIDLPLHSVFPEDEADLVQLARQLEEQQQNERQRDSKESESPAYGTDRASSPELDHSDVEHDYRKAAFGSFDSMTLPPQNLTGTNECESRPASDMDANTAMFNSQSPTMPHLSAWGIPKTAPNDMAMHLLQQSRALPNMDMLNHGLAETEFGTIQPHIPSCPNPEVMMAMGDPMIYDCYDVEPMRL